MNMDEATLEATIDAYKQQLQQIETVLQSAGSEGLDNLLQLKSDLKEVIELTQGSLLSLRKSNLLCYVDDITDSSSDKDHRNGDKKETEEQERRTPDLDKEFAAFQAAIAEESGSSSSPSLECNQRSATDLAGKRRDGTKARDDVEGGVDDAEEEEEEPEGVAGGDIAGTKCSVTYRHEWGAQRRQNAVVLSVEPPSPDDDDDDEDDDEVRVRVLFCNPTTSSMKPCPFYFKGECRFEEQECRFSHGHVVKASELKPFQDVDLSQLKIESKCLARFEDDVWYPAVVTDIEPDTHRVTVCFESYGNTANLRSQDVLPSGLQEESGDDEYDEDDDDEDDASSDTSDHDTPSTSSRLGNGPPGEEGEEEGEVDVLWVPSGPSCRLGEWETHTRGIGSKLMAMMGYQIGKGLGKRGEGRTEPVEAVIVPAGKSLDTCMKLKEMKKLGIVGKKRKKRGKGRKKKGKGGTGDPAANKLRKAKDVFEFINTHLGAKKVKVNELLSDNIVLVKSHRAHREISKGERAANTRQLNVQLMKTQEEIRSSEKQLTHLKQSLARNQRDKAACSTIQAKIAKTEEYLVTLKSSQRKLERQKTTRDEHKKLTIF